MAPCAQGLKAEGHTVRIATHEEFGDWIQSHGLEFHPLAGNPAELLVRRAAICNTACLSATRRD